MTKFILIFITLFVVSNSLFVIPLHFTKDNVTSNYIINYKKDSVLLHAVFPDSIISLKLKLPPLYDAIYNRKAHAARDNGNPPLLVNVSFLDNLDFFSLVFPFYKSTSIKGEISFHSSIIIDDQPGRDSIALIGNITIQIRVSVIGICTPQYVRLLVQNEFIHILQKEMLKVEKDLNRPATFVSASVNIPLKVTPRKRSKVKK
ncbi:MAG: hypothetical protein ABJA85_02895 [Bacteroidota bacterium]